LTFVHGTELYGQHITGWNVENGVLTFTVARESALPFDVAEVRKAIDGVTRVRILAEPRRTVAALVEAPPLGHTSVRPQPSEGPAVLAPQEVPAVLTSEGKLDNGLLRVEVARDGTLTLTGADGVTLSGA